MRHRFGLLALALLAGSLASADDQPKFGVLEGRIVGAENLVGIEGATVVVTDGEGGPVVASGLTSPTGWFHYNLPPGKYDLLAMFGEFRWLHAGVVVQTGKTVQIPGVLSMDPTEVITVHEKTKKEHRAAQAKPSSVKPMLSYSDQAMDENVWAVGWMLLDIDETGKVTAFRFLHRPGHDLEKNAEKEIWHLRFDPARDDNGNAMPSKVLWKFEWPPFHWAIDHKLVGTGGEGAVTPAGHLDAARNSIADQQVTGGAAAAIDAHVQGRSYRPNLNDKPNEHAPTTEMEALQDRPTFVLPDNYPRPPCKGSGPLNLDQHESVYRDCTPPDLGKINSEPLINRPSD